MTTGGSGFVLGQSVTTPAGGPWNNITFNWVHETGAPYAVGGLYLLTQAYAGTPLALSSSTPGYVANTSVIIDGVWRFSVGVTLNPSTQYFLYMDSGFTGQQVLHSVANTYSGGYASQADTVSEDFRGMTNIDLVFALNGDQLGLAAPEPGSAAMSLLAASGFLLARIRRRK